MLILTKIISSFLIPPGIFILIFMLLYLISKSKVVKYIALFSAIGIYFLSTIFGSYILSRPFEDAYTTPKLTADPSSVVIVLSGGIVYHQGKEKLSRATFKRLYKGFEVVSKTKGKILVSGGKIFSNTSIASAMLMKKVLMELGIPENKIIVQDRSKNTVQDALYSKKILENYKKDKIYLVTSAIHMKRALDIFINTFKNIKIIPVPCDFVVDEQINILQFFPNFGVFFVNSFAIHEILGDLWYKVAG
jgi:uncharacterized SAM-binding protein YcdF (DUF218 family)